MSLPPKNSTQNAIAAAVCAAIVVVACVPIAAFFATFGDSYNQRALIYCVILLWGVAGAVAIFSLTWRNMSKKVTAGLMIKWIVSAFLWPLLLLSWLVVGRKRRKDEQTKLARKEKPELHLSGHLFGQVNRQTDRERVSLGRSRDRTCCRNARLDLLSLRGFRHAYWLLEQDLLTD